MATDVRWHDEGRKKDGILRHPADGLAWKSFDAKYPDFASDSRNLRLALACDGFNPFWTMNTTYSEKSPGNDIDIYFPPLIKELKILWSGIKVYDSSAKQTFTLRAALTGMLHDFPAYANLSGWSTKGEFACPCCADSTDGLWLKNSFKYSYLGHRRWLPQDHVFRYQKHLFNGNEELRLAPSRATGSEILEQLSGFEFNFGKNAKLNKKRLRNSNEESTERFQRAKNWWKKKSIFFELCYWEHNLLRHNLDVMHIEKNVCDNVIDTLLNHGTKSKDNLKACLDLVELGIRSELHSCALDNGKSKIPPACFTLSPSEKVVLLKVLHDAKLPDGYSSNISRRINLKDRKISGLKSHDSHVLIQDLFPVALRYCGISEQVTSVIIELSAFFRAICSKVLDLNELDKLQDRVVHTLCQLERIFLPSFFTIMVHLIVHLVEEAKLGGPVQYRWMYPIERYFVSLKSYVKNKARPEGSIAEGYIAEECLTFCSRYLSGVETIFNRPLRNPDPPHCTTKYLFSSAGYPIGAVKDYELSDKEFFQIQSYVLRHIDGIEDFRSNFMEMKKRRRRRHSRLSIVEKQRLLNEEFPTWFMEKVTKMDDTNIPEDIVNLGLGPNKVAKRYDGFVINGIRFHTTTREVKLSTQKTLSKLITSEVSESYYLNVTGWM